LSRAIEEELFALKGSEDPRDYKCRARSLVFNLGAADGALRSRVLDGELAPAELVRLGSDDLAPDAVREERRRQREAYFRSQVHVTERVPKRRYDLLSRGAPLHRPDNAKRAAAAEKAESDAMVPLQPRTAAAVAQPEAEPGPETASAAIVDDGELRQDDVVELFLSSGEEESDEEVLGGNAPIGAVGEAIDLEGKTANDEAIARLLQGAPTTPSSSSSSSSSASDDESVEQDSPELHSGPPLAPRDGVSASDVQGLPVETSSSSFSAAGPSSSATSFGGSSSSGGDDPAGATARAAAAASTSNEQMQLLRAMGFDALARKLR